MVMVRVSMSADDTKEWQRQQRPVLTSDRPVKQAYRSLVKLNKEKHKILHLEGRNPRHQDMLGAQMESSSAEEALGS